MSILVNSQTIIMIQGMTGKEGQRAAEWMRTSGTTIVAGVTPGKGGQTVGEAPIFNSVAEAIAAFPQINATSIYAPPRFTYAAALEAIEAGIPLIHLIAEGVPILDTARLLEKARARQVRVVGPSSIGVISPGKAMIGSIGGGALETYLPPSPGNPGVVVLSKSGGMANTVASMLTAANIPQSTVIGIGGDRLIGTAYADVLPDCAADPECMAVVVIGEIGGSYEEDLASAMLETHFSKPVVAFISGLFAETLPPGVAFGHAGAIVSKTSGTRRHKMEALTQAGARIAQTPTDIVTLLSKETHA